MNLRIFKVCFALLVCSLVLTGCKKEENEELINPAEGLKYRFFYANGEKVYLVEKPNAITIKFFADTDSFRKVNILNESVSVENIKWHDSLVAEITCKDDISKKEIMSFLYNEDEIKVSVPFYTDSAGNDLGYTDEILMAFKPDVDIKKQYKLHQRFKAVVIKKNSIYQKLIVPKGTDALEVANRYYETGMLKFSQPNFLSYPVTF